MIKIKRKVIAFAVSSFATSVVAQTSTDERLPVEEAKPASVHEEAAADPRPGSTPVTNSESSGTSRRPVAPTKRDNVVEEVIVTATKRAERLQDVPISISVVSAADIDQRGLVGAQDYLRGIPGTNQVEGARGQGVVIRGLETDTEVQTSLSGPTVATYFGETPITSSGGRFGGTAVDLKLVDVERVEVLRGPQGTAFGNSSLGGAVRTIPVAPALNKLEGRLSGGYSVTSGTGGDNYNVQATVNAPLLSDRLAVRAVAYRFEESGYYKNRAGSDSTFQSTFVVPYGLQGLATDSDEEGTTRHVGGRISALLRATDKLKLSLSYLKQKSETDGYMVATTGKYEQAVQQVTPEHVVRGRRDGVFDVDIDIANAVIEYDLGWGDLLTSYSYTQTDVTNAQPVNLFIPNWPVSALVRPSENNANVGEVRLVTKLPGSWNFLAGVYYEDLLEDRSNTNFMWSGDPAANYFDPAGRFDASRRQLGDNRFLIELEQKAAFSEVSWEFIPRWTLTGGARVYQYERSAQRDSDGVFFGAAGIHTLRSTDVSDESFKANLSFKPNEQAHYYAGWSQGFRLGRGQTGLPSVCDANGDGLADATGVSLESTREVGPDNVDSYEIGGKVALANQRLMIDAAVFRIGWSGIPVTVSGGAGCPFSYTANAGEAVSKGVELQMSLNLTDEVRVDVGGSWLDAHLTRDVPVQHLSAGTRLPGSPEVNANASVEYVFDIGGYRASVRADSIYVGSFYGNLLQSPTTKAGDYIKLDTSARLMIGNTNFDIYVRNITNEDAFTFRGGTAGLGDFYGYQLRPRTIGLQMAYDFR